MPKTTQKPDQENLDPAKNVGQDDFDKIIDRNISPGDEKTMEERAQNGAADDLAAQEANAADNESSSDGDLESKEERGDSTWKNNTTSSEQSSSPWYRLTKKRSAGLGLIVGALGVGTLINLFIGPAFGLVNLKEVMVDKFDNRMTSLYEKRNIRLMSKKFSKEFTTGCTIQVKCRFKGMTKTEVKKFEKRNPGYKIEVGRCVGVGAASRCSIKSITGVDASSGKKKVISANEFKSELKKSAALRDAMRKYNNPKVAHWRDVSAGKFFNKFKVYRGKLKAATDAQDGVKGESEKQKVRIREAVRGSVSGDTFDAVGANKTAATDANGDGVDDNQTNNDIRDQVSNDINQQADEISGQLDDMTKEVTGIPDIDGSVIEDSAKTIGAGTVGGVKGAVLGPLNATDKVCAAKRLIATVGYAAKALSMASLIRYSMLFMSAADQIKAGDADGSSAQSVGDLGSILSSRDPDTGYGFFDSFGYQYAAYNSLIRAKDSNEIDTSQTLKYSLGVGMTGVLLTITNKLNSFPGVKSGCNFIGNPIVQIVGVAANLAAAFFSGGSSVAGTLAVGVSAGVAFAVAEQIATPMLSRMIAGAIVAGDERDRDASNAVTSGVGASVSMNSRFRAAFPLSKTKAVVYNQYADQTKNQIAKDSGLGGYLDTNNPRSFGGKMALALTPLTSSFSVLSPSKLLGTSLQSLSFASSAHAADSGAEYSVCNDPDYEKMNIAAGPFCDVQYGLDPTTVDTDEDNLYDADSVVAYMCGSSVDEDTPCADDKYIDDEGNPKGDYASWIEECVESDAPLASDGDNETPQECFDPATTNDPVKYTMFRIYTFDTTLDDQYNDRDGSQTGGAGSDSDGAVSGDIAELAQQILAHKGSQVIFSDNEFGNDSSDRSNPSQQLEDIADGKKANLSTRCSYASSLPKSIAPNPKIMQFLADLANSGQKFEINALFGQCHSGPNSQHHEGNAVDFACTTTPFDISKADPIGEKYGVKRNNETCAANAHWHYSTTGT
jgi:hypothetical protein